MLERREDEQRRALALAWQTAAMSREDHKLPKLDALLAATRSTAQQTVAQQRTVLETLSAQYGQALRRTRLIRRDQTPSGE